MDISGGVSGWSSGCESGWTSYLDEPSAYPTTTQWQTSMNLQTNMDDRHRILRSYHEEDEEEDLSMVSDASSGPAAAPNFVQSEEDDQYCDRQTSYDNTFYTTHSSSRKKKTAVLNKKTKGKEGKQQQQSNFLDDTASSPAMAYSKRYASPSNNQEASIDHLWGRGFSQNFSTTQVQQGNPAMFNHLGGHWQASYPKDSTDSAEPSSLRGGRW